MTDTPRPKDAAPLTVERIYSEIRTGVRETDAISFRLLGLVPLISGTALIGLLLQSKALPPDLLMLLALFAAAITLGLFRWELRNVQTCAWLIKYAEALEMDSLATKGLGGIARSRPAAPQGIGKTEAEKLIYATTIAVWLAMPVGLDAVRDSGYRTPYYVVAAGILLGTIASVFARARVAPLPGSPPKMAGPN